jgi:hypothetical protein
MADLVLSSGAWLVFPTYMIWKFGSEIVDNLAGGATVKRD